MIQQILQLVLAQFKEFIREPGVIFWAVLFPILMAWGLGIAFTTTSKTVRNVAVVGMENEQSDALQRHISALNTEGGQPLLELGSEKMGITEYRFHPVIWDEAIDQLKRGEVNMILDLRADSLLYHFDPLNPEAQLAYLQLSGAAAGRQATTQEASIQPLTQVGTRYIDFLVPGLIAFNVMMSCMWGISYGLIDKRMKKLLRRMVATPMRKSSFLIAQFLARFTLGVIEAVLLIAFAYWYFDVRIEGSLAGLFLIFLAGNIAFTGLAILISSRTAKTEVGNGMINAVVLPMMILSGIFFSYHNFPDWAIAFIEWLPLTLLADNIRSIFIEGDSLVQVIMPTLVLVGFGLITFFAGLRIYKWY
jgi:ABC-type multidrug transport system permease subunit